MILLLGIVSSMVAVASLFWSITIYIPAIARDFDAGGEAQRTPVVAAFMIGSLISAFVGPLAGRWMDARGARETMLAGCVLAAAALLATSRSSELWQLGLGWTVASVARSLVFPVPYSWLVTRWFARRRQMALGLLTIGFGLGGVAVLPLSMIEERWGWQAVMAVSSGLMLAVNGLFALLLVHDRPADLGLHVEGAPERDTGAAAADASGFAIGEALRSPVFWLLACGFMTFFIAPATFSTLQLDFFETSGVERAALVVSIAAAVRGLSRLPFGLLLGRIERIFLLAVSVAATQALALLLVVVSTSAPSLAAFVLLWGLGGAFVPMLEPIMINRAFGVKQFGTITGAMMMLAFPGTALGPIGVGALFDASGSYALPFSLLVGALAVSAGFFTLAGLAANGARHRRAAAARGM